MSMTSICILMYRCPEMSTCIKMAFRYVSKVRCLTWHVAWVTWPICILEIFRLDSPESRFLGSKISSSLPCGMSSLFTSLRSMLEGLEYLYKMSCCLNDCDEFSRLTPAKPKVIFPTQNTTQSQSNMWQTAPPQSEKISYSYCPLIQIEKFCSSCRMKLTGVCNWDVCKRNTHSKSNLDEEKWKTWEWETSWSICQLLFFVMSLN